MRAFALGKLFRSLTIGNPVLRHGLVKAERWPSAAVPKKNDLADSRLRLEQVDTLLYIQGHLFPTDQFLVALKSSVHAKHQETSLGKFATRLVRHIVGRSM